MKRLIAKLKLKQDWELDGVYAFSNDLLVVQFIEPHEGTDFSYVIRADYKLSFDRWSNCYYEVEFLDLEKELASIIVDLEKMIEEKMVNWRSAMYYNKILNKFSLNENGEFEGTLTKKEMKSVRVALKMSNAFDEVLDEEIGLYDREGNKR